MKSEALTTIDSKMRGWRQERLCFLFICLVLVMASTSLPVGGQVRAQNNGSNIYLPVVLQTQQVPRVYSPYFEGDIRVAEAAVFWFGRVTMAENYADVRVAYNANELYISVHVIDRLLWYDRTPGDTQLTDWDAVSLYLDTSGGQSGFPHAHAYRLVAQLNWVESPRDPWQVAYQGDNGDWLPSTLSFSTNSGYRGNPNDDVNDPGWNLRFHLPFSSLGMDGPPPTGSQWGLGLTLHDRDAANTGPLPIKSWPNNMDAYRPGTWGKLVFGLLDHSPPPIQTNGITTIRQGLNGNQVVDAHVGGHTTCGEGYGPIFFDGWGDANYAGYTQFNIQNQWDVADWPCFSKYYITFPLDSLPVGQQVISATLRLNQFSNAGIGHEPPAPDSLIQVLTVNQDWQENTISWNNAPLPMENVSQAWVQPLNGSPPVTRIWDVSWAVAAAHAAGQPLRLVLYSADLGQHSGKYFDSSDTGEWNAENRPTLIVTWGH